MKIDILKYLACTFIVHFLLVTCPSKKLCNFDIFLITTLSVIFFFIINNYYSIKENFKTKENEKPLMTSKKICNERPQMTSKKICVVGTHQCGSTRLFNLVRMIYEKNGKTVYSKFSMTNEEINELSGKYDIILCKIHDTDYDYLKYYDIILLPIRNILDSAISAGVRWEDTSTTKYLIDNCNRNIDMFNKFKSISDFIFKYENYNVYYIKLLCATLNINIDNNDIIDIMIQLECMLNSKDIVKKDDHKDKEYQKTLLSQNHNTSNGKTNKFINLPSKQLKEILKDKNILAFLKDNYYF